jgi:hypothetical protein
MSYRFIVLHAGFGTSNLTFSVSHYAIQFAITLYIWYNIQTILRFVMLETQFNGAAVCNNGN